MVNLTLHGDLFMRMEIAAPLLGEGLCCKNCAKFSALKDCNSCPTNGWGVMLLRQKTRGFLINRQSLLFTKPFGVSYIVYFFRNSLKYWIWSIRKTSMVIRYLVRQLALIPQPTKIPATCCFVCHAKCSLRILFSKYHYKIY